MSYTGAGIMIGRIYGNIVDRLVTRADIAYAESGQTTVAETAPNRLPSRLAPYLPDDRTFDRPCSPPYFLQTSVRNRPSGL